MCVRNSPSGSFAVLQWRFPLTPFFCSQCVKKWRSCKLTTRVQENQKAGHKRNNEHTRPIAIDLKIEYTHGTRRFTDKKKHAYARRTHQLIKDCHLQSNVILDGTRYLSPLSFHFVLRTKRVEDMFQKDIEQIVVPSRWCTSEIDNAALCGH